MIPILSHEPAKGNHGRAVRTPRRLGGVDTRAPARARGVDRHADGGLGGAGAGHRHRADPPAGRPPVHRCDVPRAGRLHRGAQPRPGPPSVHGLRRLAGRRLRRPRPGPGRALLLPYRRDARAAPGDRGGRGARTSGPVLLRHDDHAGARQLAGDRRRRRLRTHRGRPRPRRPCPAGVRAVPAARPPRDPGRLWRQLLLEQRGDRRPGAGRRRARAGRRDRRGRAPRQRHGRDLLRARRRALRLGPHRPRRRMVPARGRSRRRARVRRRCRQHS
jgi:hypothetical protein